MSNRLVAYFSATGTTASVAKKLASTADADLFEIRPEVPYSKADLDWKDKSSRSTIEANDASIRPAIAEKADGMEKYDIIFLGFPIWWYTAPSIIKTFMESYDFSSKTIVVFATSGSSPLGKTESDLKKHCSPKAIWLPGKRLGSSVSEHELYTWVKGLGI
jgi:flavodoxin